MYSINQSNTLILFRFSKKYRGHLIDLSMFKIYRLAFWMFENFEKCLMTLFAKYQKDKKKLLVPRLIHIFRKILTPYWLRDI